MRLKYFIIQLIIVFPLLSQNSSSTEVDSILKESYQKFVELKFIESSSIANEALNISILNNYSKGKVMSNIYIAKVLIEIGLNMDAIRYIEDLYEEPFFRKDIIAQVEVYRLKGRIYGNEQLYTLSKEEFYKQLSLSEKISDPKKRELSKLWAYQNIEHLYFLQEENDSVEVYQKMQEKQLTFFEEYEIFYNISTLFSNKGRLHLNKGEYDFAAVQLQRSNDILEKYNNPYRYYNLQVLGDLEAAKGNINNAITYYNDALENSTLLNATFTSRDLHKRLSEYMLNNDTLIEKAREHRVAYKTLNDSLENHNSMVVATVLENLIKDKDKASAQKNKLFRYVVVGLIFVSMIIVYLLFMRNKINKQKLLKKNKQLVSATEELELLEGELESNIFHDIIDLAKSNSPEFLLLFGEGYPDFVIAMKQLDPKIRSSELYFCALAYLNFSTKDIANYTFVTNRAVQVRKNRMRKKYKIPSEVDFNEWFRSLENESISIN